MKKAYFTSFVTILLLTFVSVAYAAFSSDLKITGEASVLKDTVPPTCGSWYLRDSSLTTQEAFDQNKFINAGTNTTWTNTNKTLFIECSDNLDGDYGCINVDTVTTSAGAKRYFKDVKNYTTSIKTDGNAVTVTLKDAYQNERTCTLPVGGSNPYVDKQGPTVTITRTAANKFTYSATDDMSSAVTTQYMVTTSSTQPSINDSGWSSTASEVTIDQTAAKTYYVWAKDGVNITHQTISTYKLTKTQGTGTTLTLKYNNNSGAELNTSYVLAGTPVYVTASANNGYGSLVLKKDSTSISSGSTQTISGATTISSSASAKEYIATFSSGNLLYGLVDTDWIASPSVARYKIENGIVTFESYRNDGYLMTLGRVYLEANKNYRFSAEADGTWGSQVEAFLMLDGQYNTYYNMSASSMSNNGYFDFIPTVSGIYHLRLDVNNPGETYHFSYIRIEQIPLTKTLTYNSELGTLPTISRVGYTFNNWWTSEVNGTQISTMTKMPASNTTYYAHWTPNKYYVYYNQGQATGGWDAAIYATQERTYPGATTLRTNSMTKSNTTANSYTVTYNQGTADGGWNATTYAAQTSKNTTTYTKDGWTTSSTAYNTKNYADGATYGANSTANLTLYPNFKTSVTNGGVTTKTNSMTKSNSAESNSYTLTFKQGTATSTAPSAITNKKYTSYTANGWTTTSGSTSRTYANNTATGALTGNVTLYPCFTQTVNQKAITLPASATKSNTNLGAVTFNYNGSGAAATISTPYTTYAFNGWYTASSGGTKLGNAGASYTPNASIDVYPQFTGTAHSATFPSPTRTGYTFAGWYTAASGGTQVTSYTGTSAVEYYAHWTPISYTVVYNKSNSNETGTLPSKQPATYDTTFTIGTNSMSRPNSSDTDSYTLTFKQGAATSSAPAAITNKKYTSYTANGWATSANGARAYTNGQTGVKNLTTTNNATVNLYTSWNSQVNQKSITLPSAATKSNINLGTVTFNYNGSGAASTTSTGYTSYSFSGWYTAQTGGTKVGDAGATYTPSASIDVYPQFTATAHSATFPSPTRTGYTFAGWYTAADGGTQVTSYTGTSAVTYYAHWTTNSYQLTVNPNGGSYNGTTSNTTVSQNYDTMYGLATPTRDGYTFNGWTLSGSGTLQRGDANGKAQKSISTQFTETIKTDTDGSQYTNYKYINATSSATTWPNINYSNYSYTSGHTYRITFTARVNTNTTGRALSFRHSAFVNDWGGTPGYASVNTTASNVGTGWQTYSIERTFTGTTYTRSGTEITINPLFEIFSQIDGGTTVSLDFDIKNIVIQDVTANTYITNNEFGGYVYRYGAGAGTLTANWTANNYTITYGLNNGTVSTANPTSYNVTSNAITLNNPTKSLTFKGNYNATSGANAASGTVTIGSNTTQAQTFAGWSGTGLSSNTVNVTIPTGSTGNRSYTAHWTAVAGATPTVTRTGYTCGWNRSSTGTTIEIASGGNFPTSYISEGMSSTVNLYAVCNPNTYTIAYAMNNGNNPNPKPTSGTYNSDVTIGTTSAPTKSVTITGNANSTGATVGSATINTQVFAGWSSSSGAGLGSGAKTGTSASPSTSWNGSATTNKYFKNLRDTSGTVTLTANWGGSSSLPTVTKTGYTCSWYDTNGTSGGNYIGASGGSYTVPSGSSTAITVYARCTPNVYTITLNQQSGSGGTGTIYERYDDGYYLTYSSGAVSNKMSTSANGVTVPTRTGYTFGGYYTSTGGAGTQYIDANGKLTSSASASQFSSSTNTLYAKWTINQYTVTCKDYFVDSSNNLKVLLGSSTKSLDYGSSVSGATWGTTSTTSTYYSAYSYHGSSAATTVPANNDLVVYRYFYAWTDLNIYYANGSSQSGATVEFKVGSGSWADVTNESNTIQPWGTTYYVRNIRPKNATEEFSHVNANLVWDSTNQYYSYTPTAAGTSMNIYMKYKIYTITLDKQSGSGGTGTIYEKYSDGYYLTNTSGTVSNKLSTSANPVTIPTKTGYTFGGYYTSTGGAGTQYINASGYLTSNANTSNFSSNGNLYAKWTPNTYTIIYDKNSSEATGTMPASIVTYDNYFNLPENNLYVRENYELIGWSTEPDGSGDFYDNGQRVINLATSGTIRLYAQWEEAHYKVGTNKYYVDLSRAIAANPNGATIIAISNYNDSYASVSAATYTLDLNGKTINFENSIEIASLATFNITGNGTLHFYDDGYINNEGTLNISSTGTMIFEDIGRIVNSGNVTISNTTITSEYGGVDNYSGGSVVMNSGSITVTGNGWSCMSNVDPNTNITINGGTLVSNLGACLVNETTSGTSGTIIVNGGSVTGTDGIIYRNGNLTVGNSSTSLSTTSPSITGTGADGYAVTYFDGTNPKAFNFYNGVLINTTEPTYLGNLNPRTNHIARTNASSEGYITTLKRIITVTADADGGSIPSTTDWTGTGATSTKSVIPGDTYGILPTPTRIGYDFKGWISPISDDYIELQYIESTGNQYINTGVIANENTGFEIDFLTRDYFNDNSYGLQNSYGSVFGARLSSSNDEYQLTTYTASSSTNYKGTFRYGNTSQNAYLERLTMVNARVINKIYRSDQGGTNQLQSSSFTTPCPITIFAVNENGTIKQNGKVRLYSFKLYQGNNLVRDFIPCKKVSTGEVGLYDLVTNEFYGNDGEGILHGGQKRYINSNTIVRNNTDHTIIADWNPHLTLVTYLSKNLLEGQTLTGVNATVSKISDTSYTISSSNATGGIKIPSELFTSEKTYILKFDVQKTSGTFTNIGGGSPVADQLEFMIDGEESNFPYGAPSTNMSTKNDNNVHSVWFEFYYDTSLEDAGTDYNIYIQPNKSVTTSIGVTITNLTLYEVVSNKSIIYGNPYGTPPEVKHPFANTVKWYKEPEYLNEVLPTTTVTSYDNHYLYANYIPNSYNLTANANGGTIPSTEGWTGTGSTSAKMVTYDEEYGTLPTPTRRGYTFNGWFPEGYIPLEFIQSSGTQYIDTGYKATKNTGVEIDYQFTATTVQQRLFNAYNGNNDYLNYQFYINGNTKFAYAFIDGAGNWIQTTTTANTSRHKLLFNVTPDQLQIDSTKTAIAASTRENESETNIYILKGYGTNPNAKAKIYGVRVYDNTTGELLRDYVPCINNGTLGEFGLYDLISETFFGNAGTGTFTSSSTIDGIIVTPIIYVTNTTIVRNPHAHTIVADWTPNTINLTLDDKNANVKGSVLISNTYGNTYESLNINVPEKYGYTFGGYYTGENGTGTKIIGENGSFVISDGTYFATDTILYAKWIEKPHTLTIDPNGGVFNNTTSTTTYDLVYSDVIDIPNPTRPGYAFTGWAELEDTRIFDYTFSTNRLEVYNNGNAATPIDLSVDYPQSDYPFSAIEVNSGRDMYEAYLTSTGETQTTPQLGGFRQLTQSAANHKYIHLFVAKLPVGYFFHYANNSIGTGGTINWLTSNEGTGNWQTYAYQVNAGSSGSFSTFGHVFISTSPVRSTSAAKGSFDATIAYATIYDITSNPDAFGQYDGTGKLTATWSSCANFSTEYSYTGTYQKFKVPAGCSGTYKLEAWGAQGGASVNDGTVQSATSNYAGGKGGYTSGNIYLTEGETIFVYVGQRPSSKSGGKSDNPGGWNGGGTGRWDRKDNDSAGGGGGATDFRYFRSSSGYLDEWGILEPNNAIGLRHRIMVAGGGPGNGWGTSTAHAGGLESYSATASLIATQTTGASFGIGGSGPTSGTTSVGYTGGGGGYWGGKYGQSGNGNAAGGSSYISGYTGSVAVVSYDENTPRYASDGTTLCADGTTDNTCSVHVSGKVFNNALMATGGDSMPTWDGTSTMIGNSGHGHAKITFISQ